MVLPRDHPSVTPGSAGANDNIQALPQGKVSWIITIFVLPKVVLKVSCPCLLETQRNKCVKIE